MAIPGGVAQLSPGNANRRSSQKLTVIPEGEREVKYRFDFVICGKGAGNFVSSVISSELAQEFLSKVRQDEKRSSSLETLAEDEEEQPVQVRSTSDAKKSTASSLGADERIMFLPVGENASQIARLRFHSLEKFTDSLQQPKDRPQALFTVVGLLCTKPAGNPEEAAKSAIGDWQSRLAELGFMKARLRPYTVTLTYGLDEDAEKAVIDCINKTKVPVTPIFQEDDDTENVVESLQTAIDKARRPEAPLAYPIATDEHSHLTC
ncbi:unnamed protein product [Prorocentrum cordatum]|uniref:THUMP domain-containing protein n=1 Tax=Prorocentrum cordatum TaxID=2364126 RepID=A0ABN9PJ68_9DINO|nr:unnamed protein product [Polarella glacialis]